MIGSLCASQSAFTRPCGSGRPYPDLSLRNFNNALAETAAVGCVACVWPRFVVYGVDSLEMLPCIKGCESVQLLFYTVFLVIFEHPRRVKVQITLVLGLDTVITMRLALIPLRRDA